MKFLLGYLNALPLTLAGFLLALVTWSSPSAFHRGAVFFNAGPGLRWFFRARGVWAFTWGGAIFLRYPSWAGTRGLITHEFEHFRQARIFGVLFPLAYGFASLIALAQRRDPYRDNYFEVQAQKVERD